nr:hypothetical protein GCM10017745_62010 [Saccharothrix mutabilis subsp. capreolus]
MRDGGLFTPLREPVFRRLVAGRGCAELANAIAPVALAFAVLDVTGSLVQLGVVVGARSLAVVLLVLFGGMLADRLPRSVILQGTALLAATTQAVIAVGVLGGFATLPLLVVLSIANGVTSAMSLPAAAALTPQTVPAAILTQANAVARMFVNSGRFTGRRSAASWSACSDRGGRCRSTRGCSSRRRWRTGRCGSSGRRAPPGRRSRTWPTGGASSPSTPGCGWWCCSSWS